MDARHLVFAFCAAVFVQLPMTPTVAGRAVGWGAGQANQSQAAQSSAATSKADEQARIGWLREHASVIRSEDPRDGNFADLAPLKRMLAGVRIVGLGEQTHGTHEFFLMKHRLVAFLVREMGFRVFAIEASQAGCEAIDDYVNGRSTDRDAALKAQGFWMWETEEMQALVDWMRAYNASVALDRRVRFVGVDIQFVQRARTALLAYLRRMAPERVTATEALFARTPEYFPVFLSNDDEAKTRAQQQLKNAIGGYLELLGFLTLNERLLVQRSSPSDYGEALRSARLLAQYAHYVSPTGPSRDYCMADNLARIVDADASAGGVVLWAHNIHIGVGNDTTGNYLRQMYGKGYYAMGFALGDGRFQSYDLDATPGPALAEFAVDPAPAGTVDWYLAQVGVERYIVDLGVPAPESIAEWLSSQQRMRTFGTVASAHGPMFSLGMAQSGVRTVLRPRFDAIVFIQHTTRARPM